MIDMVERLFVQLTAYTADPIATAEGAIDNKARSADTAEANKNGRRPLKEKCYGFLDARRTPLKDQPA